ncbi:hypothetical protein SEA_BLUERUGRAT_26 [Microbacterium phage BlueRugrat]|nr:hypothetical protein SEA_BLUERUGRAT_26 [Microbacterium phage BlueRugrat]
MRMAIMSSYLAGIPNELHLNDAAEMFVHELLIDHLPVTAPVPRANAL